MKVDHRPRLRNFARQFFLPRSTQRPSEWCEQNLNFAEPDNNGPFNFAGREYAREPIDCQADQTITDEVLPWGSQAGKTGVIMGKTSWQIRNDPARVIWVMPTQSDCRKFARSRWVPLLRRSPGLKELIPSGRNRHDFSMLSQRLGSSLVEMAWSNSPSALASTPARIINLDEVDKFNTGSEREANALDLAEQRTKNQANAKRVKSSTPTVVSGLIWQEWLKTDQRRRFVPCPHCGKFIVWIWSRPMTVMPMLPDKCESEVKWDKEAKREDGTWDLDRVHRSARIECVFCGGHIIDAHKTYCDRNGVWRPTALSAAGYRGWHLPSMYASSVETNFGAMAIKFLKRKLSLIGLRGFINGELAEPDMAQASRRNIVEITSNASKVEITEQWTGVLSIDCQAIQPRFWWVKRFWNGGDSKGVGGGSAETWEDLDAIQKQPGSPVDDDCVIVDSGFETTQVYRNCALRGEFTNQVHGGLPHHLGWLPSKGFGGPPDKRWVDKDTGIKEPYYLDNDIDPFVGTSDGGQAKMSMLLFLDYYFQDLLEELRTGKNPAFKFLVTPELGTETYFRHMDGDHKITKSLHNGRIVTVWEKIQPTWPNHLRDCEKGQVLKAVFKRFFNPEGE